MFLISACSCLNAIYWSQVLSGEWRCSWSSANRRCSNYILVINNLIAYWSATYIRDLTVVTAEVFVVITTKQNKTQLNCVQISWNIFYMLIGFVCYILFPSYDMMTSSNGNIFCVTGHLCGEFTGPRWIPHTKASEAELGCFLWSASE